MLEADNTMDLWEVLPGLEAVTFQSRAGTPQAFNLNNYSLPIAHRKAPNIKTVESVPHETAVWLIWKTHLDAVSAPTPKVGDRLVQADGTTWIMDRVTPKMFKNCFELECTKKVG